MRGCIAGLIPGLILSSTAVCGPDVFVEGFEGSSLGSMPSGWQSRFPGGGTAVSDAVVAQGRHAMRMEGLPFSANENYTDASFAFSGGLVTLSGWLMVESFPMDSDGCAGADFGYMGEDWSVVAGIRQQEPGGGLLFSRTDIPAEAGRWYHFMIVVDGDALTAQAYVDGVLIDDDYELNAPGNPTDPRYQHIRAHSGCIMGSVSGSVVAYFDGITFQGKECVSDLTGDGLLDLSDVVGFVEGFNAGCP